jgi:uncharacterized protein YbaP (TraB family)
MVQAIVLQLLFGMDRLTGFVRRLWDRALRLSRRPPHAVLARGRALAAVPLLVVPLALMMLPVPRAWCAPAAGTSAPGGASSAMGTNSPIGTNSATGAGSTAGRPVPAAPIRAASIPPHLPFYIARKANRTVYVLGTLHAAMPSDYPVNLPFRPAILDALKRSTMLAFELSPDDLVVSQNDVTRYGVCAKPCLPKQLPDELWKRLQWRLRDNQEALTEIQKMRPWLAALLIETYDSLASGLQTEYGTEAQLENIYTKDPIIGLETLSDQMRAFTGLSSAEQWEMLAQDLSQTPQQNAADMRQLHALWRDGDADRLAAWNTARSQRLSQSPELSNALDEKILFRRNRRFARRIAQLSLPDRPLFVAVGVLHLGGPRGVLAKLRENGFKVQPG